MPKPLNYQLPEGTVITAALARDAVKKTWEMVALALSAGDKVEASNELEMFFQGECAEASQQELEEGL